MPWLVWLSWLGVAPQKQKVASWFLVGAHAWVASLVPVWGTCRRQQVNVSVLHWCSSPSLSSSLPLSKIKNKITILEEYVLFAAWWNVFFAVTKDYIFLKVVQWLLEEKLCALQFAVFDKTLAELKTRVEKIECNKRHKTVLTELQVCTLTWIIYLFYNFVLCYSFEVDNTFNF